MRCWNEKMDYAFYNSNEQFVYFNPPAFLNHLDRALRVDDFNPYLGKTYDELLLPPLDPIEEEDIKTERVRSNPGMTTYYNPAMDSDLGSIEYIDGKKYSKVNGFFNAQYKKYHTDYTEYWHEGIDFRGKTGSTVVSLVRGKVLRCGKRANVNQGFIIIQSDADENLFYLALHVDHNTLKVNDGEPVYPGKELAKTIYLPDSDGVDQSHLHVSVIRLPEGVNPISNEGVINQQGALITWGKEHSPNQSIWKKMINPFNYNDSNTWKGRY